MKHGRARLAIVDDHALVRSGLRSMLRDEDDFNIVGEASNGWEALALCYRVRPDLVLMDVRMPKMDGLEATRNIKREYPETSVLIVTMHENPDYLLEALKAGAAGYVLKDSSSEGLIAAVRKVIEGESPLNRKLATDLLRRLADETRESPRNTATKSSSEQLPYPLTPREIEVLKLMALGQTNREISQNFVISVGTTKNHVEHIIAKLAVSDRTQAVVRALERGIIDFPSESRPLA